MNCYNPYHCNSKCHIHFSEKSCWIDNSSTKVLIAQGSLTSLKGLYTLDLHSPHAEHALSAQSNNSDIMTWHHHLGHANYQTIKDMTHKHLIEGMPATFSTVPPDCDSCVIGKQTKTPVSKKCEEGPGNRATQKLEKVWVDLIGPISVTSTNGNHYVMDLLDDYMSKGWSIPLKSKDWRFLNFRLGNSQGRGKQALWWGHILLTMGNSNQRRWRHGSKAVEYSRILQHHIHLHTMAVLNACITP